MMKGTRFGWKGHRGLVDWLDVYGELGSGFSSVDLVSPGFVRDGLKVDIHFDFVSNFKGILFN